MAKILFPDGGQAIETVPGVPLEPACWRGLVAGVADGLDLPFDRPRPAVRGWRRGQQPLAFSPALSEDLAHLAAREGVDLSLVVLAGFLALLGRMAGQEEIALGIAGNRQEEDFRLLRADLAGDPEFRELLACASCPEPLDLPLEKLLEADLCLLLNEDEGIVQGSLGYDQDLFDATTIARLADGFGRLLAAVAADPGARPGAVDLMGEAERHQVMVEWNDTRGAVPASASLPELFARQVARTPEAVALVTEEESFTYAELSARAAQLARHLQSLGVGPEVPVGVFLERSPDMVVAILGILAAGGVYVPLDPAYPRDRVNFILEDARAVGLITAERLAGAVPDHEGWRIFLDALEADGGSTLVPPALSSENLAYLIYTSGSTGRPKGVAIRHGSAALLVEWAASEFPAEELSGVLFSTSICFDLSVFELFVPLSRGGRVVLAKDALALPSLGDLGVTLLNTVPSAAAELVRQGTMPASVRTVNLAGEALRRDLTAALYELPQVRRVLNLYGPSEDTTYSTWTQVDRDDPRPPSIGRPLRDTRAYVVDRRLRPVPLGVAGELCLGGEGLARGYLGRPDLTAEKFIPDPLSGVPGARLYRTGDLALFRPDGHLSFLGRLDHQVKVRGFRIELGEIESALMRHPSVREVVVVAREDVPGDKRLVAYVALDRAEGVTAGDLRSSLRESLPEYMLPSAFVFLEALPRTPNGKVDRKALPAPAAGAVLPAMNAGRLPSGPVEEVLAGFWSDLLGIAGITADADFFELGGHSLLGSRVLVRVRDVFGVELPLSALFAHPTLADLAATVEARGREARDLMAPPLVPVSREGRLPLSFAQQRLWFMDQAYPGLAAYNVPVAFRLEGELDAAALEAALGEIVRRHEALRTRLAQDGDGPYQVIDPATPLPLPRIDLSTAPRPDLALRSFALTEAGQPFDLGRGPLLRGTLVRLGAAEHVLLVTLHHVVADGWSLAVLQQELEALYEAFSHGLASPLPELPVQYADFAVWQQQWLQGEELAAQLGYWKQSLAGAPAVLDLPADRPRPAVPSFRGATRVLALSSPLREALATLSRRQGATLFMTLLAGFQALLHRLTGQDDLVVGTVNANRSRSELEGLIGFFANTLALRTDLSGEPSFEGLLARTREAALGAYAHQDLPFEKLVEELQPERDLSRNPIFQVLFQFLNAPPSPAPPSLEAGLRIRSGGEREHGTAKFDLYLYVTESAEGDLTARLEHSTDLFDPATAERLLSGYAALLAAVAADPGARCGALDLVSEAERHQVMVEWNDTLGAVPASASLPELFARQVARTPEAVALVTAEESLTYAELSARAAQLARHLQSLGVGPEVPVGVFLERSPDLVVAILGILAAGGVYVPLDPAYPSDRVAFILGDAQAVGVITEERLAAAVPGHDGWSVFINADLDGDAALVPPALSAENLAYLIYTSGSTGRPKGVAIRHGSAALLVEWAAGEFPAEELSGVLFSTSICFDLSVFELFVPLSRGGRVVLAKDALALPSLGDLGVTLLNTVPSAAAELVRQGTLPASVQTVNLAGEALRRDLADALYALPQVRRVLNLYGPSEDTTYSTWTQVDRDDPRPPSIGRPLRDTRAYVVDRRLRPVPLGVAGELCLGGEGLARGYLGRPDLTAEKFIPDPLSGVPGARLYRTGDLALFRPDGHLSFLGRLDHQVKVRGFRIELGEIESALMRHPSVREVVVVAREDVTGDKRLVAYVALDAAEEVTAGDLRSSLRESLPEYMLPSAFVFLEALPRTPNGKVDRKALPVPAAGPSEGAGRLPSGPVEEVLAGFWSDLLGIAEIPADANFFELGGHSLLGSRVLVRVRDVFGVELPLSALFAHPTLAGLAGAVEARGREARGLVVPPLRPISREDPREGRLPLSFAQQRLWFMDQAFPGLTAYNLPVAFRLEGELDAVALEAALGEIVRRHEALRTRFVNDGDGPFQVIDPAVALPLQPVDLSADPFALHAFALNEAGQPFDLGRGPLLRATLVRLAAAEHVLLLTIHHVAADGWSLAVLQRELEALYEAFAQGRPSPLPELPVQYADFAVWQRQWLQGDVLAAQLDFWKKSLAGAPAVLDLPSDRPLPAVPTFRGATRVLALPAPLREALAALSRRQGATLFMTLLAGFQALLHRLTGQDDLVVGTVIANRNRSELEGLIGFFANTLALRTDLAGEPSFKGLVARAREAALGAYAHQDLPFEKLVEELQPERDLSRNPIFQTLFQLQNAPPAVSSPSSPSSGTGLQIRPGERRYDTAKFDLSLFVTESAEGGLTARLEHSADLFDPATAERLLSGYAALLAAVVADPGARCEDLDLVSEAERHQVMVEWNDTRGGAPAYASLPELFARQVARTPEAVALVTAEESLTYAELSARAAQLARHLQSLGVGPEVPVGVFLERSPDLVVAILGILAAGGVYVPLDPAYPSDRVAFILGDAQAVGVITEERLAAAVPGHDGWSVFINADLDGDAALVPPALSAENLAYLIYTSGSTGRPKGVAIRHGSAALLVEWAASEFPAEELSGVLFSTSICFDLSVFELFVPLSRGGRVVLAKDALALPSLGDLGVTLLNTVPSAAAELVRQGTLPASVQTVNLAGEALRRDLADALYALPQVRRVLNLYGPSEDTTYSTWTQVDRDDPRPPSIGRPLRDTRAYVVDRRLRPVPLGVAGELCLGGEGLARGYLGRPDLTAEKFIPDPLSGVPGARLYRTGDLALFRPDGHLSFLGRLDHQVKVRGFRIELGEIESALMRHPSVREVVVVAREDVPGDKRLVAYVALDGAEGVTASDLRSSLRESLPEYMLPSAFVFLEALPRTPNGKVDRKALPAPGRDRLEGDGSFAAPRTPTEELVAGLWSDLLGLEKIGVHDHFFELGGHSLLATQTLSRIRERFGVELPLRTLFAQPTVAALAQTIDRAVQDGTGGSRLPAIVAASASDGPAPLSFGQQRLLLLDQLVPGSPAYVLPTGFRLNGRLSAAALEAALGELVRRHEILRTVYTREGGGRAVLLAPAEVVPLSWIDLRTLPAAAREAELSRLSMAEARWPFDLENGPVLRAFLLPLAEEEQVLFLSLHHIAGDAWSLSVLWRELGALYGAYRDGQPSPLPGLGLQYADFARWQRRYLTGEALAAESAYWLERLRGAPPVLELPADRPRPAEQTLEGGATQIVLDRALEADLVRLARREDATLFMTLLAGFLALLQRYTGTDDLVVGSPIANRNRGETEGLIGFFINALVLRTDLSGEPDTREVLARVRETALSAYAHQDLPFEKLVEELKPERDPSRNPVFQISFQLINTPAAVPDLAGLATEPYERENRTAKFDLELAVSQTPAGLVCAADYSSSLFAPATVERFLSHYQRLLGAMTTDSVQPVSELPLLSRGETHQILAEWNDTAWDTGRPTVLHALIAERLRQTPDAVAVVYEGTTLTCRELDERANALAHGLRERGVGPEVLVGICLERSLEMVVGLLAILKAGGAYVPLDPGYPDDRLAYMLEDSRTPLLLTQEALAERLERLLPAGGPILIPLKLGSGLLEGGREEAPEDFTGPDHPAYAIYTSGSTGRPKGAVNTHRALINRLLWMQAAYGLDESDRVLQKTPFSFDVSVWEFFWPLLTGARLVVARPGGHQDSAYLVERMAAEGITTLHFVPSMMQIFLATPGLSRLTSLRRVIASGEALPFELKERFFANLGWAELHNLYGPTEAAIDVTAWPCAPGGEGPLVPIGRPISNLRVHVLDRHLRPTPLGVPGELYLSGAGLARGYLHRPALTAERFIPDPFAATPGERMYKTGDLVRRLPDGTPVYLGRLDHQVKLRGLRIELGEIEAALAGYPGVREVVVVVRQTRPGDERLVAYVVPEQPPGPAAKELREHLRTMLPEFMVPGSFVTLDALPLTPNGKVDRKALPAPGAGSASAERVLVAPRTPTEERLARIWASALSLAEVGVTDDFFDLGGHSLLALHVITTIRSDFGLDLPLGVMFRGSTVETMAALIDSRATQAPSPLALLGGWSSDRLPLFAVHGVGGNVFRFVRLARHSRRPFYGIQGWSDFNDIRHLGSVAEMAERYMAEIRKIQPRGPYFLAGVCLGCMVAFEMARRFRAENEPVAFLGLFDTSAHNLPPEVLDTISFEAGIANELAIPLSLEEMKKRPREEQLGYVVEEGRRQNILPAGFTEDDARRYIEVFRANMSAFLRYNPPPSEGVQATLFNTPAEGVSPDPTWGWGAVALGGVEVIDIPGDNASMLRNPHVEVFAERLGKALDAAEENWTATHPSQGASRISPASTSFVAPRNETEQGLAEIWQQVIGLERVSVCDNFLDLGGHSLLALHLVTHIRNRFGVDLPLAATIRAPTIERLAAHIACRSNHPASHVIPLGGQDLPGTPLFCVHGLGGHVFRLADLGRLLSRHVPFYGIQGWADLNDMAHLESVESMAQRYVGEIRKVQPHGPYRLAGYSMGGVIAYEMARMLTADGESLDWLGLIDSEIPLPPKPVDPNAPKLVRSFESSVAEELGFAIAPATLSKVPREERLAYVINEGLRVGALPEGFSLLDGQRYIHVFYATFSAHERFLPGPWEGRFALFRTALAVEGRPDDPTLGWKTSAAGGIEIRDIGGDHKTLMQSPHVEDLAGQILDSLAGAGVVVVAEEVS